MIPLKTLKQFYLTSKDYDKLSDIKQIKINMEYDYINENTQPLNIGPSLLIIVLVVFAFLSLFSLQLFQIDPVLGANCVRSTLLFMWFGLEFTILFFVLDIVFNIFLKKKKNKCLKILFNRYFTKINRKVKK